MIVTYLVVHDKLRCRREADIRQRGLVDDNFVIVQKGRLRKCCRFGLHSLQDEPITIEHIRRENTSRLSSLQCIAPAHMVRRRCRDTRSTYNHLPCALHRQHALVRERNSMNCQTVLRVPASEKSCAVIYHGIHSLWKNQGAR